MPYIRKGAQTEIGRKIEELAAQLPYKEWYLPDPYNPITYLSPIGLPFSRVKTDFPVVSEMLAKPEYFARAKKVVAEVVDMSPSEYLKRMLKGLRSLDPKTKVKDIFSPVDRNLVKEYAERLKVDEFPMPHLDYRYGFGQEGRHRVLAAKLNKMKDIPVVIIKNIE